MRVVKLPQYWQNGVTKPPLDQPLLDSAKAGG
jgi:hypothetical protein